jgi:hypothetical protein
MGQEFVETEYLSYPFGWQGFRYGIADLDESESAMDSPAEVLASSLIGVWEEPELTLLGDDGYRMPFPRARGRLVYSPAGVMMAAVELERPAISESGHELMAEFLSYSGRFEVDPSSWVSHHVDISLPAAWAGTTLRRRVTLRGAWADLDTPSAGSGSDGRYVRISWRRVHPGGAADAS